MRIFCELRSNTLIPSVKMTLTVNKMFAGIVCQTIEREVDFSTAKKIVISAYFEYPKHPDSPSSAGIRPVVNRLN